MSKRQGPAPSTTDGRSHWWIEFTDRPSASVSYVTEEEAERIGGEHGTVKALWILPYPAKPRLNHEAGQIPSFCWRPESCKGRSSCPRQPSCVE